MSTVRALLLFLITSPLFGAFPSGWTKKCPVVIDHTKVTADQTAFPVVLTTASFTTNCGEILTSGGPAQSDGGDLRISSDAAGTSQLALEVVAWTQNATPASAVVELWTPVNVLTGSDVTIYVWYSAGGGQTQPAANAAFGSQAVWDSNFKAVYHLQTIGAAPVGTSGDSTASGNNLLNFNGSDSTSVTAVAGQISNAGSFAGTSYRLINATTSGLPSGTGVRTIEGWFKRSANTSAQSFFGYGGNSSTGDRFNIFWANDGNLYTECNSCSAQFTWTADTNWNHVASTLPSGTTSAGILMYLNGSAKSMSSSSTTLNASTANLTLSTLPTTTATDGFFGLLDEVRISNIARSSTWISTEYNNQNSPGTFAIAGAPIGGGNSNTPAHGRVM